MTTATANETKVNLALDAIRSKRRLECVVDAGLALLERYSEHTNPADRATIFFELVRKNFTTEVTVVYGALTLGPREPGGIAVVKESADVQRTDQQFQASFTGADGTSGSVSAHYVPPGRLGLTIDEWQAALRLLAGIFGMGLKEKVANA